MNLSKKTIKHILRILDNKCNDDGVVESRVPFLPASNDFTPRDKKKYGWIKIIYIPKWGKFWGIYSEKSEVFTIDWDSPDINSPIQLADL